MPIDPVMKAILDQIAQAGGPPTHALTPAEARMGFNALMMLMTPNDIALEAVEDIAVPGPAGAIPVRVYRPRGREHGPQPSLVYFHGGGFVLGDVASYDGLCRLLARESGVTVCSVDYRLAPEHRFPAAVEDAMAALEYVGSHAGDLGLDPARLAVGGDSAGGALAAIAAQSAHARGAPSIAFQLLVCPLVQMDVETPSVRNYAEGYFLERPTLYWFADHYLSAAQDRADRRVSPINAAALDGLPPAYVMTAEFDPLHDQGVDYAERMRSAGVPVESVDYPGLVHNFIYFQAVLPQAAEAWKAAASALARALRA